MVVRYQQNYGKWLSAVVEGKLAEADIIRNLGVDLINCSRKISSIDSTVQAEDSSN